MRRRTIIALVLTVLCAVALNRYWLVFRPFQIGFDIKGQGIVNIQVLLNKKDDNEFKKVKKAENTINLSDVQFFEVEMNHVTSPKRLKLALHKGFSLGGGAESLSITGIELRGGKYRLNDLENFSSENAVLKVEDGALVVTPEAPDFAIYYNRPLNARSAVKFDFKLLIIIFILSFLLFYKVSNYLADFKSIQNASRADIFFLLGFFALLFVPMHKLDNNVYSDKELRPFAVFQPLVEHNEINFNWGNNFNNYFSDHFWGRNKIVEIYCKFKYFLAYKYYTVHGHALLNKKNHWGFRLDQYSLDIYKNLDDSTIKKISDNFNRLNKFCEANNIKLYIVIAPSKEDIYKNHNPYIPLIARENFNEVYSYLKKQGTVNIIFPEREFKKSANEEYLFFKTDHHWTDSGAFIAYGALSECIKKDFPDFNALQKDDFEIFKERLVRSDFGRDFNSGQTLYAFLNLHGKKIAKKVLDVEYPYYKHKQEKLLKTEINYENMTKDFYFSAKNNLTAIEIGNSQSENFNDFLPYSFKHLKYFRANNGHREFVSEIKMSNYEDEILNMKPDILILTMSSAYIIPMLNMYESEN